MKIYKTTKGILIEHEGLFYLTNADWDRFINNDQIYADTLKLIPQLATVSDYAGLIEEDLLAPIGTQEIWATGVTYMRSKSARMEESKDAGGGDFYDRVYDAERPELFF